MAKGNSNSLSNKSRSSKPYDVTNSFVKQVKDRMTSYLPRFGLFSPPIAVEERGIAAPASTDLNESSSEDDETSSQQFAPPKKRARSELNQPSPFENLATHTPNNLFHSRPPALDFIDGTIAGPSGISRRPCLASSTPAVPQRYPLESNLIQSSEPLANGDNDSNSSMSTSGCSSLIPQAKYQAENNKSSTSVNNRSAQQRGCFGDRDMSTFLQTSRSMLDGSAPRATSAASSRRPSFNASVFSAPSPGAAESAASIGRSPFYAGRTQFGGASSYRRPRGPLFTPLEAVSPTARPTVQVKTLSGSSALDWGSCTARKILDTLDHLSSPVIDAKRIPSSPVLGQRRKRPAHDASPGPVHGGPPTDNLIIPTVQDLLKMQRQNQMRDSMEAARKVAQSPALNPTPTLTETEKEYRTRLDADRDRPAGGKMTSRMRVLEDEMRPAEPRLPNVSLTMDGLPTFDLDPPTKKDDPDDFMFHDATPLGGNEFTPESVKSEGAARKAAKKAMKEKEQANTKPNVTKTLPAAPAAQFSMIPTSVKPREKSGFVEKSKAAAQNGKVGFTAAAELRVGSVMDVLGKKLTPAAPPKLTGFGEQFKPEAGSWSCGTCLVSNTSTATKCISCNTTPPLAITLSQGFGAQFKPPVGSWSCDMCMVQNKSEATICASCTTARPAAKVAPTGSWTCVACVAPNKGEACSCTACATTKTPKALTASLDPLKPVTGFGSQFKVAAGSWECDSCMVRNKPDVSVCVSCSTARPAAKTSAGPVTESTKLPTLGFGTQFSAPAATWECPSCLVRNGNGSVACIACETRKPVARGFMATSPQPASGVSKAPITFGSLSAGFGSTATSGGFGTMSTASGFGSTTTTPSFGATPSAPSSTVPSFGAGSAVPKVSGFGDAFKKAVGAWDCDSCMVRNTSGDVCVACEAARPGSTPADSKPTTRLTAAPTFAFGIDKAGADAKAAPAVTGFSFGAAAPAVTGGFSFGIPAKTAPEATKPAELLNQGAASGTDRKRKGEDDVAGPVAKTSFSASESSETSTFGVPKTNGPVATPTNNLFAFGKTASKQGSGFGATPQAGNLFSAATNSTTSSLFKTTTSSATPTTNMFSKTTSSFTPTSNFFATDDSKKPSTNLFATTASSTTTPNFFATTAVSTAPATSLFTTAATSAPSAVFAFGTTTQTKPAPVADSAPKVVTFGSGFGVAKPLGGFGTQPTPSLGFPASNVPAPTASFGVPAAKTEASSFGAAPFVFGQAPKPAEKAFGAFGQPTESKGFNFSATPAAPNASAGFGFAAPAPAAPATFAFSATPAPAPAGAFGFGQPTAFNPSAQPKFNFTGGEVPQFTAAGVANSSAAGPRRIIKKAVRRTPR